MALATVSDYKLALYAVLYVYEKESGVVITPDNNNVDGDLTAPNSALLYSLVTTGGMNPTDVSTIAGDYVAWKRTVKDVRQNSPVGVDQPYGSNGYYNNAGNI